MEQGRKKRLPKRQAKNSMVSLSTPLREGIDLTIEDSIAAAAETSDELTTYVEKILDSITEIEDEKKLWVLRLSMMGITKAFFYFLSLRLCVRFFKSVNWQMKDAKKLMNYEEYVVF